MHSVSGACEKNLFRAICENNISVSVAFFEAQTSMLCSFQPSPKYLSFKIPRCSFVALHLLINEGILGTS